MSQETCTLCNERPAREQSVCGERLDDACDQCFDRLLAAATEQLVAEVPDHLKKAARDLAERERYGNS